MRCTIRAAAQFERIADPENKAEENILNDGRCDSRGRFWVGSMTKTMKRASGKLYRVEKGRVDALDDDIWVSNGVAWSPDETTLYFADSHVHTIFAYDYDLAAGTIGKRRVFAETKGQAGVPDGASVDAEGYLWTAMFDGGMHRALRAGRAARPHRADAGQPRHRLHVRRARSAHHVCDHGAVSACAGEARERDARGGLLALDVGVTRRAGADVSAG